MFPWRGLVSGGNESGCELARQIRVSKHTSGKTCFRVVDMFPTEVNLVTRLLRQIRAKSAPDSWSLANTRMLYYVFRSAGQVLDPFSSLVAWRLIICVVMTPQTDSCFETYASYGVFPWRGFDSSGINLGTVALWLLQIMVSKHTPNMAFLRAWTCFRQMEELKHMLVKTCFVHKYAWAGRLWQDGVLGPASLVIVGRWRREVVELSTVRTNYHKV